MVHSLLLMEGCEMDSCIEVNRDINMFAQKGYVVVKLVHMQALNKLRDLVRAKLKSITKQDEITLETFQNYVKSTKEKISIQYEINSYIWKEQVHIEIFKENIEIFEALIGRDLDIQKEPYIRVARPQSYEDNIGFHRDSFYGNSAYEISNFIPLVNLDNKSALMIEEESHKKGAIPYTKVKNEYVQKGSKANQLGFLYEPKVINSNYNIKKMAVPLKFGEMLIFNLGLIHGQEVNSAKTTRWSMDTRIKNSFAPSKVKKEYYRELSRSPVSECASIYYESNGHEV